MSNWLRATLSPSTLSMMNICRGTDHKTQFTDLICVASRHFRVGLKLAFDDQTNLGDTHLVGGERACLVWADDGGAAQSLHGGKAPDDGILLGHTTRTQSQASGDYRRQTCDVTPEHNMLSTLLRGGEERLIVRNCASKAKRIVTSNPKSQQRWNKTF